ncbi:uncharacterized protein [Typha latifolia]|uniref:uncharacterized protein isoform X2 n=1 Tax=Typha latifolia TaxID=4733 RepID=UPI003C2B946F
MLYEHSRFSPFPLLLQATRRIGRLQWISSPTPQCGCGGEVDFVPQFVVAELSGSLTGHMSMLVLERDKLDHLGPDSF